MRDEQKGGGVLAVVLAVVALLLLCLFAVGSAWVYQSFLVSKMAVQKAIEAERRAVDLSIRPAENQESSEATMP
jgi:hypothetical protein